MGRPLKKSNFGNTSGSGQQVTVTAFIPGDNGATSAYIVRQKGRNKFSVANAIGTSTGTVQLVNGGVALVAGQGNITVTPFGSTGSGGVASARLGLQSVTIGSSAGTSDTTHYYVPGEILHTLNGTATAVGNISVASVTLGSAVSNGGNHPGYTVGDTFTWGYAGYDTPVVITVASTTGNGNVGGISYTSTGAVSNVSVTNVTSYSSSSQTNAWATGQGFTIRWDLNAISVVNPGDYLVAPANPAALTGSTHGTGANVTIGWEVSSVSVTNGGTGYSSALVAFTGTGGATAVSAINAAGSITGITVTAAGSGYTATPPTVTFPLVAAVQYADSIKSKTVRTFSNNTYEWVNTTVTPVDGQAALQTS